MVIATWVIPQQMFCTDSFAAFGSSFAPAPNHYGITIEVQLGFVKVFVYTLGVAFKTVG